MADVVIVGGGTAGFKALHAVSEQRPDLHAVLISAEAATACERPMLSKEMMASDAELRRTGLPAGLDGAGMLVQGEAKAIDRVRQTVMLEQGGEIGYDRLILATGSRPRKLPFGPEAPELVHYLRTEADASRLAARLPQVKRVAVIGGGFIGLEFAAAMRARGIAATVIEMQSALLGRSASREVADHLGDLHRANGVEILLNAAVAAVGRAPAGGARVETSAGALDADLVVVGVGVIPNVELAVDAGLEVTDGIVVDAQCRTSDPRIFAAGEVTNYPVADLGLRARTECWTAANDQGLVAGINAAANGDGAAYRDMPWLWSDQYSTSIQAWGLPYRGERITRFALDAPGAWLEFGWSADGRVVGAMGVNASRQIAELRRLHRKGLPVPERYLNGLKDRAA